MNPTKRIRTTLLGLALAVLATPTLAHEPASDKPTFELVYQAVGAFVSTPGEDKPQFLARVGNYLAAYTRHSGWEACGQIMERTDGQGWAVNILTNGSQVACAQVTYAMEGYVDSGEGIHSHPARNSVRLTLQDVRMRAHNLCGNHIRVQPQGFSETDYAVGPGYLVTPGDGFTRPKLMYQAGKGTETRVATLDEKDAGAPDRAIVGKPIVGQGLTLVASELGREDVQWGQRTCKTF